MTATPVWFGPATRPLFGWFHAPPDLLARGGVVICPPFVREHLQAHYALRLLAEALEAEGMAVLRFDYDGMGDSAGDERDPGRVGSWVRSIHEGVDLMSAAGVAHVSLVGMRMGALLATRAAAERGLVPQLVLWDPCASGRSYLHEQSAVTRLALRGDPHPADGSTDTPGLRLCRETVHELRGLDIAGTPGPVARRVLVLTRDDRERCEEAAGLGLDGVEFRDATGQAALMDAGMPLLQIPSSLITGVAGWLADGAPTRRAAVRVPPPAGPETVARTPEGAAVVEHPIFFGPAGLFGMVTEVPGSVGTGPAAVFMNVSNGHHVGPNRMWVDLARRWAAHGIRSIRFDLSGLGESPVRAPGQEQFVARPPEAFVDVADAAGAISPGNPRNVVLVGHCAAAYQALDSGLDLAVVGVVAVNPVLTFVPPELERRQPLDGRRRVALPRTALIQSFAGTSGRFSRWRERLPSLGWWVRLRLHPRRRPGSWLRTMIEAGTDVLVVNGEREHRPFRLGMSRARRRRLERSGRLRIEYQDNLEHGLLRGDQRDAITDLLTEHVVRRFGAGPAPEVAAVPAAAVAAVPVQVATVPVPGQVQVATVPVPGQVATVPVPGQVATVPAAAVASVAAAAVAEPPHEAATVNASALVDRPA